MPILTAEQLPKYRKHRASGQAIVTLNGRDHYLGPHGTKASHLEYDRLVAEWLARGRTLATTSGDVTIVELLAAFRKFAVGHFRKNGKPTRSLGNLDDAIRPLRLLYGRESVADFGPKKLKAVRYLMVNGFTDPQGRKLRPLAHVVQFARLGVETLPAGPALEGEASWLALTWGFDTRRIDRWWHEARVAELAGLG